MLIFDQLKKDDPQLRFLAVFVMAGLLILLCGLWWTQLVSTSYFQKSLENQSTRSVRIPPVRGQILDRNGIPLADNQPLFTIDLFLEELSGKYQSAYRGAVNRLKTNVNSQIVIKEQQLHRKLNPAEQKKLMPTQAGLAELRQQVRYAVTCQLLAQLSEKLREPVTLSQTNFERWYEKSRVLALPVVMNLNQAQIARFEEQSTSLPGVDLEVRSLRHYPHGSIAAHLLGYLQRDDQAGDFPGRHYSYPLTDYNGVTGIEHMFDEDLHGAAGVRSVIINNQGFRQPLETMETPPVPGENLVLTLDYNIQKAAEDALRTHLGVNSHCVAIVMDPRNGDVLAMASHPSYDPNFFVQPMDPAVRESQWQALQDTNSRPQLNRAMYENYHPGSIFKIVVGLAALETGLDPNAKFQSLGYYPMKGLKEGIGDTAGPGEFDFVRALAKSSNPYFITQGMREGVLPRLLAIGQRLHFGERTGLFPRGEEARGNFPTLDQVSRRSWLPVETAYLSIGQGRIDVTPLQIAVMISAVANGGAVYSPRVVSAVVPGDGMTPTETFAAGRLRDTLGVSDRSLRIVREAMLADVNTSEGTGHAASVPGLAIAGKTGTAEVENRSGKKDKSLKDTWFVSFAPYESPRYAVVVMVEGGASGGLSCAPVARDIYTAILKNEQQQKNAKAAPLASIP